MYLRNFVIEENSNIDSHIQNDITTTDLEETDYCLTTLALFSLLHLSKSGVIYLGSDRKLLRDFQKKKHLTISQKAEIIRVVKIQIKRNGMKNFFSTLKKLNN